MCAIPKPKDINPSVSKVKTKQRVCKVYHDGIRCNTKFTPRFPNQKWCSDKCQKVVNDESLVKIKAKRERDFQKKLSQPKPEKKKVKKQNSLGLRSLGWFHDKAEKAAHAYVRYRDRKKTCISCDKPLIGEIEYHAGHYLKSGSHKWIAYDERNINGQCIECNCNKDGNEAAQRIKMIERYGVDVVIELETSSNRNLAEKSYNRDDLLSIELHYKKKLKKLKAQEGE